MPQLSEQAKNLIDEFEKRIENIPVEERDAVLKRMTSHILALNEDVRGLFGILKNKREAEGPVTAPELPPEGDIDNIRDYI